MSENFAVDITNLVDEFGDLYCVDASMLGELMDKKYRVHGEVFTYIMTVKDDEGDVLWWKYRSPDKVLKIYND